MKKVLFVCVHNSGRSQIATAYLNALAKGKATADSAGTKPAERVNPTVAQVMKEVGLDISTNKPKALTFEMMVSSDKVITMGCGSVEDVCPASIMPTEDWQMENPEGKPIDEVRRIRDQIKKRVEELIKQL